MSSIKILKSSDNPRKTLKKLNENFDTITSETKIVFSSKEPILLDPNAVAGYHGKELLWINYDLPGGKDNEMIDVSITYTPEYSAIIADEYLKLPITQTQKVEKIRYSKALSDTKILFFDTDKFMSRTDEYKNTILESKIPAGSYLSLNLKDNFNNDLEHIVLPSVYVTDTSGKRTELKNIWRQIDYQTMGITNMSNVGGKGITKIELIFDGPSLN